MVDRDSKENLVAALLASGFPFQTAIAELADEVPNCGIAAEEFPWRDDAGDDQFLDLVVACFNFAVVVECKKAQKGLIFLQPSTRNKIWETVKTASPYRKPYVYCSPPIEKGKRLPQILSIYLLMFFLGSVTRYSPGDFEDLFESRYGPFFDTFISESPMLYLMASDILGREVSKPAII